LKELINGLYSVFLAPPSGYYKYRKVVISNPFLKKKASIFNGVKSIKVCSLGRSVVTVIGFLVRKELKTFDQELEKQVHAKNLDVLHNHAQNILKEFQEGHSFFTQGLNRLIVQPR